MSLRITDVATGKHVKEFDRRQNALLGSCTASYLAFLSDGKELLLKDGHEAVVRLLDPASGAEIRAFRSEGKHLYDVALSADGKSLAVAEESGTVRVWEIATGKEQLAIKKYKRPIGSLAFAPDGKTLATGNEDVDLWDAATGHLKHTLAPRIAEINWTDSTGKKHVMRNVPLGQAISLSFAADGKSLVSSHGRHLVFWDPATGKETRRLERPSARGARFLSNGKMLLVGGDRSSWEHTISFIDPTTGAPLRRFDGHDSAVHAIALTPDGNYVATAEDGGLAATRVWETSSGRVLFESGNQRRPRARALAFSPQGNVLATGNGQSVFLWDQKKGKVLRTLAVDKNEHIHSDLIYSDDGLKLASASLGGAIVVWDADGRRG